MSQIAPERQAERTRLRLAVTPLRSIQVRDSTETGDGSWTMEGYAAVYEQETTLFEIGGWWRMREEIARGAFENVLSRVAHGDELVHFNHGHDMTSAIAATNVRGIGGLELADDPHGLRYHARVDSGDPDAVRLAVKMRRGIVSQASFAFTIEREELVEFQVLDDGTEDELWRILEIGHLYDVCACAQGAYPQTESFLRSYAAAFLGRDGTPQGDPSGRRRRNPTDGVGVEPVAPDEGGGPVGDPRARAVLTARARAAKTIHSGGRSWKS